MNGFHKKNQPILRQGAHIVIIVLIIMSVTRIVIPYATNFEGDL